MASELELLGMDFSSIRGLVFFGILFIASFLLSPGWFLRPFTHRQQVWVVRRLTNRHWSGVNVLFTVVFFALTAWLVLNKAAETEGQGWKKMRQNSANGAFHSLMRPIALQVLP
jgi:hypothetical protein